MCGTVGGEAPWPYGVHNRAARGSDATRDNLLPAHRGAGKLVEEENI